MAIFEAMNNFSIVSLTLTLNCYGFDCFQSFFEKWIKFVKIFLVIRHKRSVDNKSGLKGNAKNDELLSKMNILVTHSLLISIAIHREGFTSVLFNIENSSTLLCISFVNNLVINCRKRYHWDEDGLEIFDIFFTN